jgi:RHS repeat-associated protein
VRQRLDVSGQVVAVNDYRPFGAPLEGGGGDPYGFTGEWWEGDAGLLYLRARYYDPATGQFLSPDPWRGNVWRPGTLNRYAYVLNDPINDRDPSGLRCLFFDQNCDEVAEKAWDWVTGRVQDVATVPWRLFPGEFCLGSLGCWGGEEYADWLEDEYYPNFSEYESYWTSPPEHTPHSPLTPELWALSVCQARKYGIPVELLAGTIAVEIEHDTDIYEPLADQFLLASINCAEDCFSNAGVVSELIIEVWEGARGGIGAGPGVANFHTKTARAVEEYYQNYYSGSPDLILPYSGNDKSTSYRRLEYLVSDEGNVHYTAAYLRMLADYRKGSGGLPSIQPHLYDLTDDDATVINGAFRSGMEGGWSNIVDYQNAIRAEDLGLLILPYLERYREFVGNVLSCSCGE